jgi:hypothetical protein
VVPSSNDSSRNTSDAFERTLQLEELGAAAIVAATTWRAAGSEIGGSGLAAVASTVDLMEAEGLPTLIV